ncbi:MAG TPA: hypothetical protein VHU41_16280 [Thermoanaerobaculia bacterium]|nr:hypothetical protein [Thermoanaerobaculia bacterium]
MRNVVSQLGRIVSVVTVVVLLTAPTTKGASFLLDRDGDSGRVVGPINRVIHAAKRWVPIIWGDELVVPQP